MLNKKILVSLMCLVPFLCKAGDGGGESLESLNSPVHSPKVKIRYELTGSDEEDEGGYNLQPITLHKGYTLTGSDEEDDDCYEMPPTPQYKIHKIFELGQQDERKLVKKVGSVRDEVEVQLKSYPPQSICVIYDVDGTQTEQPDPEKLQVIDAVTPRGSIQSDILWLDEQGVKYVHSSAWNEFAHTVMRVNKIHPPVKRQDPHKFVCFKIGDYLIKGYVQGHVASVTQNFGVGFYRDKAVSPLAVYPDSFEEIKVLLFGEDSPGNIKIFLKNLTQFNPYPQLEKVITSYLDKPEEELND